MESKSNVENHHVSPAIMSVIIFIYFYLKGLFCFHKNTRLRALKPTIPDKTPRLLVPAFKSDSEGLSVKNKEV